MSNIVNMPDSSGPQPPLTYESTELAREIVSILRKENIHPILVFGNTASGKTLALQSLFHYLKSNDDVGIKLTRGSPIWPADHPVYKKIEEAGRVFLDNDLSALDNGGLPQGTSREAPFFIPVDLIRDGHRTRLAFLEGMGEWFERERPVNSGDAPDPRTARPFREFKQILAQVLRSFEFGISMIFVAPCVDTKTVSKEYAHECLANAIEEAGRLREEKNYDNLLLLVNKWDAVCSPGNASDRFSDATADVVLDRIRRWRFVWPTFVALDGFPKGAKAVMPYSAAWIQTDGTIIRSPLYAPIFARYNRTVWNWIYGNASIASLGDVQAQRKVLYEDVLPEQATKMGSFERLTRLIMMNRQK